MDVEELALQRMAVLPQFDKVGWIKTDENVLGIHTRLISFVRLAGLSASWSYLSRSNLEFTAHVVHVLGHKKHLPLPDVSGAFG
ncbi:hypothetical protein OPV22_029282 [Ensete ventricosum]|uniref:Uncharacterized protein n=1 Tax=Ensete ventricosum TaxID=4639 RepID=A0AAV8QCU1_ENSVE|nr:hypothetical protein OPV22_029282 [Ensete ventricosum]